MLDALVHLGACSRIAAGVEGRVGEGLVEAVEHVVGQTPGGVQGDCTAREAQTLAQQQEAVGAPVAVVAGVVGETAVCLVLGAVGQTGIRVEFTLLGVTAAAEVELRLEQDGSVLAELVLQTYAEAVTVREAVAETVGVGDEGGTVVAVSLLISTLLHVDDGAVVQIVGAQLHLVSEEIPVAVDTAHPGRGDAVVATPAAHSTAHHTATAHHVAHHTAGQVVETAVVGIVGIGDDGELTLLGEAAAHEGTLPAPVVHALALGREVVAAAGHHIAEDAVHHALLDGEVDDGFVFTVIDAGEFGLLALLLHHLHFLHQLGGDILGGQLRVVQEEGLAFDGNLGDGFTVGGDGAVFGHLDAGQFLQEVYQHIVIADLEGGGVVLHGVLLDHDGVTHSAHGSGVQHLAVLVHLHHAKVYIFLDIQDFLIGQIPHEFGFQSVLAGP